MITPPTIDSPDYKHPKGNKMQQQLFRRGIDINNLFNKLISFNYKSESELKDSSFENDLGRLFDELIWAEKHHPTFIYSLFQMQAIEQVSQIHSKKHADLLMKNFIILMTNSIDKGLLAELLLQHQLPSSILRLYIQNSNQESEETIQYTGSFLKMYHRLFSPQWMPKFIHQGNYFELLELSFKFYNCPELISRTTVLNIIFSLLAHEQVRQYLLNCKQREHFYFLIIEQLTKQLRTELAGLCFRLNHTSKDDDIDCIFNELQDKIAYWFDIAESLKECSELFHRPFIKNIILPLLIGPLEHGHSPLFTLKFSLYVLKKLIPTINQLGLLECFVSILFKEQQVAYWPSTLNKNVLLPFKIHKLMDKQFPTGIDADEQEQIQQLQSIGPKIKTFYLNIFKSRDNHFLMMSTALLCSLIQTLKKQPEMLEVCQLKQNGKLLYLFNYILINQLNDTHSLNSIMSIIDTLVYLNNKKPLDQLLQGQYLYIFKDLIKHNKQVLHSKNQYWDSLIQTIEYDLRAVEIFKFGQQNNALKYQQMYRIVFTWDPQQQQNEQHKFYSCVPDTNQEYLRYMLTKFMILRKGCQFLFNDLNLCSMKVQYFSKIIAKSPFISNDIYRLNQIKSDSFQCQWVDRKNKIPIVFITDDNFFVVGHLDKPNKQIRIILSIKYKHISLKTFIKKQKMNAEILVRDYDSSNQRIIEKDPLVIRGVNKIIPYILASYRLCKQRQLSFISNMLKNTEAKLPKQTISLI